MAVFRCGVELRREMLAVSVPKGQAVLWNYLIQGSLELTEVRIRFK